MWKTALVSMLNRMIADGTLDLKFPDGTQQRFGDGGAPRVGATIHQDDLIKKIILNPEMAVGEAYMDGTVTIEDDDLYGFLELAVKNVRRIDNVILQRVMSFVRQVLRNWRQFNPAKKSKTNVEHHYDLSGELYDLFLDEDRQYSCAYFSDPSMSLENAQRAKKEHIAKKLCIEPGMTVLDIGCGWGGMAITLARDYRAKVVGVTLSEEQHKLASERVKEAGLADQIDIRIQDYRHVNESFDRIVSVGMFEHVGVPHYREYFRNVHARLRPDGVALIHTIGRMMPPGWTSPWIDKYIFPGGYCPSLSETSAAIEHEDLYMTDVEVWRLHYAETLKNWHDRFMSNAERARELYDDRFVRMWRYYLIACESTFRWGNQCVFQIQLTHDQEAVPLTRDYISEPEKELAHAAE